MYKRAWCMCKVVVLPILTYCFFAFSLACRHSCCLVSICQLGQWFSDSNAKRLIQEAIQERTSKNVHIISFPKKYELKKQLLLSIRLYDWSIAHNSQQPWKSLFPTQSPPRAQRPARTPRFQENARLTSFNECRSTSESKQNTFLFLSFLKEMYG